MLPPGLSVNSLFFYHLLLPFFLVLSLYRSYSCLFFEHIVEKGPFFWTTEVGQLLQEFRM